MKLIEKFERLKISQKNTTATLNIDLDTAKECEKIADEVAIEFGNWLNNNVINTDGRHHNLCFNSRVSQLFPIFKREKGL